MGREPVADQLLLSQAQRWAYSPGFCLCLVPCMNRSFDLCDPLTKGLAGGVVRHALWRGVVKSDIINERPRTEATTALYCESEVKGGTAVVLGRSNREIYTQVQNKLLRVALTSSPRERVSIRSIVNNNNTLAWRRGSTLAHVLVPALCYLTSRRPATIIAFTARPVLRDGDILLKSKSCSRIHTPVRGRLGSVHGMRYTCLAWHGSRGKRVCGLRLQRSIQASII